MKVVSKEYVNAAKMPATAVFLTIAGVFQFIGGSWLAFGITVLISQYIGAVNTTICLAIAIAIGISASLMSFTLARIVCDLHTIRWNSDGYVIEREKGDYAAIARAVEKLSENIETIIYNSDHPDNPRKPYQTNPYDNFDFEDSVTVDDIKKYLM